LLRTIRKAYTERGYEDSRGRNGLHCLAEVSLNLPIPEVPFSSEPESNIAILSNPRERYLEDLLGAGVDPNSYDKRGITPIMAFIIYLLDAEDDFTITPILSRLLDAGANIHCRNRRGETPLHIAVKLGRRAATKFLINHKANIHARDKDGIVVIALGKQYSVGAGYDVTLYAHIMLCIEIVANAVAVSSPTILQEWASP
jgi:ankyrin repeat protein